MKLRKCFKVLKKLLVVVGSLAGLGLLLAYMSGAFFHKVEPGTVESEARTLGDQPTDEIHKIVEIEKVEIVGSLRAERRTDVSSRIMATIVEMNARAGESVNKDDVVVKLDDRDLTAQLEQARQAVVAAEADFKNAEEDYERFKKLLEDNVISRREFDQAETRYKIAKAQLSQAREAETNAATMLSYANITAPVSGIVVDKLADVGDTAVPGKPLLAIYDPSVLRLEAAVPEALVAGLEVGDVLEVKLDTIDKILSGPIEEIVPQAETASRSMLIKVRVPKEKGMVEGMFGRLLIPSRERVRLCLASSAVIKEGQLRFVDVVKDDNTLERRQVKLGQESEYGRVETLSGLEAGERVVLYGPPPKPFPPDKKVLFNRGEL